MSEKPIRVGQCVNVASKGTTGTVAFVGSTIFSQGKWIGVILDEPFGKNNGTVQGKSYFECEDNHGIFLRQTQLSLLDDSLSDRGIATPASEKPKSRLPVFGMASEFATPGRTDSDAKTPQGTRVANRSDTFTKTPKPTVLKTPKTLQVTNIKTGYKLPLGSVQKTSRQEKEQIDASPRQEIKKSASFIETGFVETLTPQFTAGSTMPMQTLEDKASISQLQQENENLKSELRELQEKIEIVRGKRNQDKDKIKEGDKLKLQVEQLLEFKSRIMESQAQLQKELQKSKLETQEAIEAKELHVEETQELMDNVEMLTLDKEMAEEKAEALQLELEASKERIEELQVDLELMKNEEDENATVGSSVESKQLQQQNDRLRETLVRLRDLSAHDKHEMQKLQKDIESLKTANTELSRSKEKLSIKVTELEQTIADLQEQVDAALGAEEMVETLTERNLDLEEKVEELLENVTDLEAINDMNDQLQENARDLELELREELDLTAVKIRTAAKEKEAMGEVIADQESTILKFRDLVHKLQEQNSELRQTLEKETNKPMATPSEIIDFKKMFTDSKAQIKTIELELRKLEVYQANKHVSYLIQYLPDTFTCRGGDHDAVSVLLILSRITWKCDMITNFIFDRYSRPEVIDRNVILKQHSVDQFSFASRILHLLYMLRTLVQQYYYIANSCNVEMFLKLASFHNDILMQEKNVEVYIELLKKDQLSESTSMEPLEKCILFFDMIYRTTLFSEKLSQGSLLADISRTVRSATDTVSIECDRVKALIDESDSATESAKFWTRIKDICTEVGGLCKRIRRRMPQDGSMGPITFPNDVQEALLTVLNDAFNSVRAVCHVGKACMQQITINHDIEKGVSAEKVKELIHQATDLIYDKDDQGPESISSSMTKCLDEISKITNALENGEYDFDGTTERENIPPVSLRAEMIKKELKDTEQLKYKLEHRDADIKDLKLVLKQKNEEISQMVVRRDMAEKKLSTATRDSEIMIEKLQRKYDDAQIANKRIQKEYETTTDHLQQDIDSLAMEKGELRKKLQAYNKEKIFQALSRQASAGSPSSLPGSPAPATSSSFVTKDSPLLLQQIEDMKGALQLLSDNYYSVVGSDMRKKMASLKPLKNFKSNEKQYGVEKRDSTKEEIAMETQKSKELFQNASRIKKEVFETLAAVKVVDISNRKGYDVTTAQSLAPSSHLISHVHKLRTYKERMSLLQNEANELLAKRICGGSVKTSLASFPSTQLVKATAEKNASKIGQVTFPSKEASQNVIPLMVQGEDLKNLHLRFLP